MKTTTWTFVFIATVLFTVGIASAQEKVLPQLRQFTPEQRWSRLSDNCDYLTFAAIAHAKSLNRTSDDMGQFFAKTFAPSWGKPNSGNPMSVFRGLRYNYIAYPAAKFELLDSLESKVAGRYNRWYLPLFKDTPTQFGVSLDEFEGVWRAVNRGIAEYLGLAYEDHVQGEWVEFSLSKK